MKATIAYYSKTGNTRKIAEAMAQALRVDALPIGFAAKGRKTKEQVAAEKRAWDDALTAARTAELVIVGTPTEFRKPHPTVVKFVQEARPARVAVFCTCYGMPGATMIDLEAVSRQHSAQFVGGLALHLGTERYRFRREVSEYAEKIAATHLARAREFARSVPSAEPAAPRLRGACGRDCVACANLREHRCEGAATRCWSERGCDTFDCCVLKKSLNACTQCPTAAVCGKRARRLSSGFDGLGRSKS